MLRIESRFSAGNRGRLRVHRVVVAVAGLAFFSGCASLALLDSDVRGTLRAEGSPELPAGSAARIEVVDVAQSEEARAVLGRQTITDVRSLPLHFRVVIDADRIEKHPYAVRAEIRHGDRILYQSEGTTPVLTGGHPRRVELQMVPID